MPRVRLRVWHDGRNLDYTDPARPNEPRTVPSLRLMTTLLLGPDPARAETDNRQEVSALIDTGAPFNLIDAGTWELFERRGLIESLQSDAHPPPLSIGGTRSIPYTLGRIQVGVLDPASHSRQNRRPKLPAVGVVFQLLGRSARLPHPIILGMRDGILDGRWLTRESFAPVQSPENRYDIGPRYGQQWWLQDEPP